ncbi:hypothetical protein C7380_10487 [Oceanotoga teriensis]|uniref:Uncharacterized protein n=2 Tax=Oceanotoga teriensis TaxID=515440 RepID=A0AA45C830_9BACT|nr:hypothetical protein C7380_10487 [Oceanotoga teriensis]
MKDLRLCILCNLNIIFKLQERGGIITLKSIINLVRYSRFSKPFLKYILKSKNLDEGIRTYIKLLFLKWDYKFSESLSIIEQELKKDHKTSIKYLLMIEKSNCTDSKEDEINIYYELKNNIARIPIYIRNIAIMNLKNTEEKYFDFDARRMRSWSDKYKTDEIIKAWILFSEARKDKNNGNIILAYKKTIEAVEYLKKILHPFGIMIGLNNAIWWIKDQNDIDIYSSINDFEFYLGYYIENEIEDFRFLDTLLRACISKNYFDMYEIAYIIDNIIKKMKNDKRRSIYNNFQSILNMARNISYSLDSQNEYTLNTTFLDFIGLFQNDEKHKYLGLSKRSYFNIMSRNVKKINKSTVRKIIKNNKIKYNTKVPNVFISEIKKMKIEEKFKENIKKFENMDRTKKIRGFLISYLSEESDYIFKTKIKYVFDEKFNLKKVDYRLMQIINRIFEEENSYYRGRKEITSKFINRIKENKLEKFMKNYQKLEFEEMEMMKKFIRNYGRYDIKTVKDEFYPKTCEEIDWFIQEYGLNPKLCGISVFAFDLNERKKFLNFMNEMKI